MTATGGSATQELLQEIGRDLVRVRPAPGSAWVAVRVSTTLLLALTALAVVGRLDLVAYASFGGFASVYGGPARFAARWRMQASRGVWMTGAVLTGAVVATTDARAWLAPPVAAAWAVIGARVSTRRQWRPPGPLFLVFAAATSAGIPVTFTDLGPVVAAAATTAALAVALGVVEVRVLGANGPAPATGPVEAPWRTPVACGVAALAAGTVATASGLVHPSWAMVAAVVPFSTVPLRGQLVRGVHRVAGTAVGLVLAGLLLAAMPLPVWAVILVLTGLQAATELWVVRQYGVALVFITPLALTLTVVAQPSPGPMAQLLVSRILETVLGVAIGLAVALLARPGPRPRLRGPRRLR